MIPANELRIGNWVKHLPGWSALKYNENDEVFNFQWTSTHWLYYNEARLDLELLEPIKLSPEILEKIGFKSESSYTNGVIYEWSYGDFIIRQTNNGYELFGSEWTIGESFKYVHELQNMYHAIWREELEIKL